MRHCLAAAIALALLAATALADEPNQSAPAAVKFEKLADGLPDVAVSIEEAGNNVYLYSGGKPVAFWDGKRLVIAEFARASMRRESAVPDACGNTYALVDANLVVRTNGELNAAAPVPPKAQWEFLAADNLSFVFLGGKGGLVSFDPRKVEAGWVAFDKTELAGKEITALGNGPDGAVLAGTSEGKTYRMDRLAASAATRFDAGGLGDQPIRAIYTATDGSVYVVAGGTLYRAAPAPNAWQKHWQETTSMPYGAHDVYGAVLDGKLYIPGGMADRGLPSVFYSYFKEMCVYDPNAQSWSVTEPMTEALCYCGTAVLDKKVWVIGGGKNAGVDGKHKRVPVDVVHVYDPATKKWQIGPKLPHPIMESVVVETGGRIYSIGGMDANEKRLAEVLSIGAGETQWRAEPNAPMGVQQAAGCVIDGVIYVANMQTGLMSFDPKAGTWEANLPKPPGGGAPSAPLVAAHKGEVWMIGGYGDRIVVEELPPASQPAGAKNPPKPRTVTKRIPLNPRATWHYNPKTRTWAAGPDLPGPRCWGAAVELNGHLYIAGGAYGLPGLFVFPTSVFMLRD